MPLPSFMSRTSIFCVLRSSIVSAGPSDDDFLESVWQAVIEHQAGGTTSDYQSVLVLRLND